jgi:spore germination protein YaaH
VQADMLAAHLADKMGFAPGALPSALPNATAQITGVATTGLSAPAEPRSDSTTADAQLPNGLRREVLGFLPYWMLTDGYLPSMRYDLVSTIAYFGINANPDGTLATNSTGWNGWNSQSMTEVINAAHARGVRVVLTITMMAWDGGAGQATLLGNATARSRLVAGISAAVKSRNADGVNLDFEPVYTPQRDQYTSFVRQLKAGLAAAGAGSYLTVCTTAGAATWSSGYDVPGLAAAGAADHLFVMGYDYSWSGSARSGGVAPMESPYLTDVHDTVRDFLNAIPGAKLIWGVPYYGRTWLTTSDALNAPTIAGASGKSKAYYYIGNKRLAQQYGRRWDAVGQVPWFAYWDATAGSWVQGYYDDVASLSYKWDMVNQLGLAGTGMWTLLMDAGSPDLWLLLSQKFVADSTPPAGGVAVLPVTLDSSAALVSWRAIDGGSGMGRYTVQTRDRTAGSTWADWLVSTTRTSAYWIGAAGHTYEFRVSAADNLGNRQPWVGAALDPGSGLAVGGYASVAPDTVNVRAGAGTGFAVISQRTRGDRVAILAGPISAGGYAWYEVQFGTTEWPSADYPRIGWMAAASGATAYLVPAQAPTVTRFTPAIAGYSALPRTVTPNGDGAGDSVTVGFSLPEMATDGRVDVLDGKGTTVRTIPLGGQTGGAHSVVWDGRLGSGAWAPNGQYLLRLTITDSKGIHVAPAPVVTPEILAAWGVTAADSVAPTIVTRSPAAGATEVTMTPTATVRFSEPVIGVSTTTLRLRDVWSNTLLVTTVAYDGATLTATLRSKWPLQPSRLYQVEVGPGIGDPAGNALIPASWSWLTTAMETYSPSRGVRFAPASVTGYQFTTNGTILRPKTWVVTTTTTVQASRRGRIASQPNSGGAWYYLDTGPLAGYWVKEAWISGTAGFNPTLL